MHESAKQSFLNGSDHCGSLAHPPFTALSGVSGGGGTEIVREVLIDRDTAGSLGLSIAGGLGSPLGDVPIIIASMQFDGPAARTGKLTVSSLKGRPQRRFCVAFSLQSQNSLDRL